ncbi:MAG: hypothetical protein GF329_00695 [Candidatus Lokiarchaeota archaeon]|nr:hypothetical protein [Candidatus Lokiarchaeota archaeon]
MTLEKYKEMMERCIRCSLCKWIPQIQIKSQKYASICPSIDEYNFHNYSGGGRIITSLALLEDKIPFNEKLIQVVYTCTECGGCDVACKYLNDLEPLEIIQELRERLVEKNIGPLPNQKKYIENTIEFHNPYGEPHENRTKCYPDGTRSDNSSDLGYFIGCTSSYRRQEIAKSTINILNKLGINFQLLGSEEYCCGSPMYRVGEVEKTKDLMKRNIETFKKLGIKTIITSCAGCYAMFKAEYTKLLGDDLPFEVHHTIEYIQDLIEEGKIDFIKELDMKVTYHDPCHLGRGSEEYPEWHGEVKEIIPMVKMEIPPKPKRQGTNGCYQPPRDIIGEIPGLKLVEMERIREFAYCCGAGGGVKAQFPVFAINTAKRRIEEALHTSASTLVSCCPFCKTNLMDGIEALGSDMKFYDLIELIEMSLGDE